jgi:hypothetical protein
MRDNVDATFDDFAGDVLTVIRSEWRREPPLPLNVSQAVEAIYAYWAELGPDAIEDIDAHGTEERALRVGRHTVLRTSRAWQPVVFGTATFVALVLSGGIGAWGGVALAEFGVRFLKSFTRIQPYNRDVFETVCRLQQSHRKDGGPTTEDIAEAVGSGVERETVARRLRDLEAQGVLRQHDGRWTVPL